MGGSDDGPDLFAGVEAGQDQQDPLAGDDTILPEGQLDPVAMLKQWARDLTYDEMHAFIIGFAPWFLFLVTGEALLLTVAVGVTAGAFGFRKLPSAIRYVIKEAHYCLGGSVLAWLLGSSILAWSRILAVLSGVVG